MPDLRTNRAPVDLGARARRVWQIDSPGQMLDAAEEAPPQVRSVVLAPDRRWVGDLMLDLTGLRSELDPSTIARVAGLRCWALSASVVLLAVSTSAVAWWLVGDLGRPGDEDSIFRWEFGHRHAALFGGLGLLAGSAAVVPLLRTSGPAGQRPILSIGPPESPERTSAAHS